jgi:hypothetical protein
MIVKHFLYLSKLAAQMVTSTSSENLFCQRYGLKNQNLDFKIFSMKTLSKLGALTVPFSCTAVSKVWNMAFLREIPWGFLTQQKPFQFSAL